MSGNNDFTVTLAKGCIMGIAITICGSILYVLTSGGYSQDDAFVDDIVRGNVEEVRESVTQNPDLLNQRWKGGLTALHYASSHGQPEVAEALINAGADLEALCKHHWTPVTAAVDRRRHRVLKILLDAGADPEASYLHRAARIDDVAAAKLLVSHGVDVDAPHPGMQSATALHIASRKGHMGMVEFLIDNGANLHAETTQGETPLSMAEARGHGEVVAILRKAIARTQ
jgi:ankyrin repeat protein